jgi:hypothetical protein
VKDRLKELDQRFIRAAAPRVAKTVDEVRTSSEQAVQAVREIDLKDLSNLDQKFANKGALGFFREVPQLMAVVVGVVFILGTIVAARQLGERAQQQESSPGGTTTGGPAAPLSDALGPDVGSAVPAYLATSAQGLTAAAKDDPDGARVALVSLGAYYRPEIAASILSGYVVKRAWVRDPSAGKLSPELPLDVDGDVLLALKGFYSRQAVKQLKAAQDYQRLADTTSSSDAAFKAEYTRLAALSRAEAKAYGSNCACVFSFVVTATPTQLLSLRSRPGVRALEVSGKGQALTDLTITPLVPEATKVVPAPPELVEPPS